MWNSYIPGIYSYFLVVYAMIAILWIIAYLEFQTILLKSRTRIGPFWIPPVLQTILILDAIMVNVNHPFIFRLVGMETTFFYLNFQNLNFFFFLERNNFFLLQLFSYIFFCYFFFYIILPFHVLLIPFLLFFFIIFFTFSV